MRRQVARVSEVVVQRDEDGAVVDDDTAFFLAGGV